jgi:hypothetical protein
VPIESGDHQALRREGGRGRAQALQGKTQKRVEEAYEAERDQGAAGNAKQRYS